MAHPPGPYSYGQCKKMGEVNGKARLVDRPGWFIQSEARKLDLAEVHCTSSQDKGEQEAVARLFAGSPALYEQAMWVVRLFGTDHPKGQVELRDVVAKLRHILRDIDGE